MTTATIKINGVAARFARVPYGQSVALLNNTLAGVTSQTWDIKHAEAFDPTDPDVVIKADHATNWPAWTYTALTQRLNIDQAGAYPSVAGIPDVPGHWRITLTTQGDSVDIQTAVIEVLGPDDDQMPPVPTETTETGAFGGWARNVNRGIELDRKRAGWVRLYNGTGGSIASGKVCKLAAPVDFRVVSGNANPGGTATRAGLVFAVAVGNNGDADALRATYCVLKAAIANGAFGWGQVWGMHEADLTGIAVGADLTINATGDIVATGTNDRLRVGAAITGGASGVTYFDGMAPVRVDTTVAADDTLGITTGQIGFGTAPNVIGGVNTFKYDSGNKRIGVWSSGTAVPGYRSHVVDLDSASDMGHAIGAHYDGTTASALRLQKSRGTFAAQTTVVVGDYFGAVEFWGHDGTNPIKSASFGAQSNFAVTTAQVHSAFYWAMKRSGVTADPVGSAGNELSAYLGYAGLLPAASAFGAHTFTVGSDGTTGGYVLAKRIGAGLDAPENSVDALLNVLARGNSGVATGAAMVLGYDTGANLGMLYALNPGYGYRPLEVFAEYFKILLGTDAGTEVLRMTTTGLGVFDSAPGTQIDITDLSAVSTRGLRLAEHNSSASAQVFAFRKSRGTKASPTAVASGDYGGTIFFENYAAGFIKTAFMGSRSVGAVSGSSVPTSLWFGAKNVGDSDPYASSKMLELWHDGAAKIAVFNGTPAAKQTVSGTRIYGAAQASLIDAMAAYNWITDSSTAGTAQNITGVQGDGTALTNLLSGLATAGLITDGTSVGTWPTIAGSIASGQVAFGSGTNTLTGDNGLLYVSSNLMVGTNSVGASTRMLVVASKTIAAAPGAVWDGVQFGPSTATITGTATIAEFAHVRFLQPTASSATSTISDSATVIIDDAPTGSCTQTRKWSLWAKAGNVRIDAALHFRAVGVVSVLNTTTDTLAWTAGTTAMRTESSVWTQLYPVGSASDGLAYSFQPGGAGLAATLRTNGFVNGLWEPVLGILGTNKTSAPGAGFNPRTISFPAATFTYTGTGQAALGAQTFVWIGVPTFTRDNANTYTTSGYAATVWIDGPPVTTNVTVGALRSLFVNAGISEFGGYTYFYDGAGVTTPGWAWNADTNTGMFRGADDTQQIICGGVAQYTQSTTAITTTVPNRGADGSAGSPTWSFTNDTGAGMTYIGSNLVAHYSGSGGRHFWYGQSVIHFEKNTYFDSSVFFITGGTVGFFGASPVGQQTLGGTLTNNVTSGGTTRTIDNIVAASVDATAADLVTTRNAVYQLSEQLRLLSTGIRAGKLGLFT